MNSHNDASPIDAKPPRWISNPALVEAMAQLGAVNGDDLVPLLHASDDEVAQQAAWLLGNVGSRCHSSALMQSLASERAPLWMTSAMALTCLDSRRAKRPLLALMLDQARPAEQRYASTYALAFTPCALHDPQAARALMRVAAEPDAPPKLRGVAVEGIGNCYSGCFGGSHEAALYDEAAALLVALLGDPEVEVRFWAAFALGSLRYTPALFALHAATADHGYYGGWWTVGEEASDAIDRIEGREPPERIGMTHEEALAAGRTL